MSCPASPAPVPDPQADASGPQRPERLLTEEQTKRLADLRKVRAVDARKPAMRAELDLADPLIEGNVCSLPP